MKKILSLFSLFVLSVMVRAQTTGQIANYNSQGNAGTAATAQLYTALGPLNDTKVKLENGSTSFQGSPYTSNDFLPTKMFYDNEEMGDLYYRYNAFNEEIEIKEKNLENEPIRALTKDKKITILVDDHPMGFKTFIDKNGVTQNGYLTKLKEGPYTLYQRTKVKYKEGQKAQNSFVPAVPSKFTQFTEFYVEKLGGNRIDELELNNKKLLKLVNPEQKEPLKSFLKSNSIKIKKESDLHQIFDFLNK